MDTKFRCITVENGRNMKWLERESQQTLLNEMKDWTFSVAFALVFPSDVTRAQTVEALTAILQAVQFFPPAIKFPDDD